MSEPIEEPLPKICQEFDKWFREQNYELAVEICMYCSQEGGFVGAAGEIYDLISDFEASLNRELSTDEQGLLEDHTLNLGEYADMKDFYQPDE